MKTKTCSKCKNELPVGAFYVDRGRLRLRSACKECTKAKAQEWRDANRDAVRAAGFFYRMSPEAAAMRKAWLAERAKQEKLPCWINKEVENK